MHCQRTGLLLQEDDKIEVAGDMQAMVSTVLVATALRLALPQNGLVLMGRA